MLSLGIQFQLVSERRPERQADINERAATDFDAGSAHLAVVKRERSQATHPDRALEPERSFEPHAAAKAKIKPAQVEADFTGTRVYRPAIA